MNCERTFETIYSLNNTHELYMNYIVKIEYTKYKV